MKEENSGMKEDLVLFLFTTILLFIFVIFMIKFTNF